MDTRGNEVQVAIVGAGPTGTMLGIELARRGIEVSILDRRLERSPESRAIGIHARTLEVFHQLGVIDEFLDLGHRVDGFTFHLRGQRRLRFSFGALESRYPFLLTLSQAETQRILEEQLARLGVSVQRGVRVLDLHEADDGVALHLRRAGDQREQILRAAWVVGCDGAHSMVRRRLGLPFDGDDYAQDWLMAEVNIDPEPRRDHFHVFAHAAPPFPIFPMSGGRWRLFLPQVVNRPEERQPPEMEEIEQLVAQRGPGGMTLSNPSLLATFRCYRRSAKVMRRGHVLIAGDAAHIHSPAGGQGMNTGLQDAFNLGWKLALVAGGRAPATLLDSYQEERAPVAAGVLAMTHGLVRTFTIASPRMRWVRDRLLSAAVAVPGAERRYVTRLAQLSHSYRDRDATRIGRGALVAGDRLPYVAGLRRGDDVVSSLDLLCTPLHTLLVLPGRSPDSALARATVARFAPWSAAVRTVLIARDAGAADGAVRDAALRAHRRYGALRGRLVLVRPDGYVARTAPLGRPEVLERYLRATRA
ncbi:MAG: FAD-dependent monooxygenase [Solirubrobacterales bacterium]|nr:FAD-dependent monooxygenase [Solirubrobacterales bacterium]